MQKYDFLDHPSDIKLQVFGRDLEEVFVNAALGMMEFVYGSKEVDLTEQELIEVEAESLESLLVNWLAEILYLSDTNKRVYLEYRILSFSSNKITALVKSGATLAKDDIKAVTYHDLTIEQMSDGTWRAVVVFDI